MDKKDISLTVTLELGGDLCGMTIKDKNYKVVQFEDLVRSEQIKILNCLSQNYNFLVRFLKEKEGSGMGFVIFMSVIVSVCVFACLIQGNGDKEE